MHYSVWNKPMFKQIKISCIKHDPQNPLQNEVDRREILSVDKHKNPFRNIKIIFIRGQESKVETS